VDFGEARNCARAERRQSEGTTARRAAATTTSPVASRLPGTYPIRWVNFRAAED
jgi:hypothetical protein